MLKEELVNNFTESFVHLTHAGIKNISHLERKFYQNIFSPSLNEKVKKILSQKIKEQRVAQKQQREKDPPKDIDLKPEESRNPSDKPTTPIAKMKITRQKPLKLKLRKTVIADDGELLEPNHLSLLCLCFVVALIAVVLVGDFTLLNTYIDKIMHRSELEGPPIRYPLDESIMQRTYTISLFFAIVKSNTRNHHQRIFSFLLPYLQSIIYMI